MKVWEIKAQALRLMFADTDLQFSEAEFTSNAVYDNANTREKLVRMDDSIRRAIDLYYQYKGEPTLFTEDIELYQTGDPVVYSNYILTSAVSSTNFGFPTRIDLLVYEELEDTTLKLRKQVNEINFDFFETDGIIHFFDVDYRDYITNYDYIPKFRVWYKTNKISLPATYNEITYDVNTLEVIPEDVQRMIPYFIKGELYEEDEPNIAMQSRTLYIQYLMGLRKKFNKTQTKVKSARVFSK
jgi:hypothetical protein